MGTPKLFILSEQMRGASFSLTLDKYSIGRADDCDVCIADPTISGHHCTILKLDDDESYALRDDGSTNGTKVNDQKLEPGDTVKLNNGDILQVGGVEILFDDIQGERVESRTISVINLNDTSTSEINKTSMKNLGDRFTRKKNAMLRENRSHNKILNIVLIVLGVAVAGLIGFILLR